MISKLFDLMEHDRIPVRMIGFMVTVVVFMMLIAAAAGAVCGTVWLLVELLGTGWGVGISAVFGFVLMSYLYARFAVG